MTIKRNLFKNHTSDYITSRPAAHHSQPISFHAPPARSASATLAFLFLQHARSVPASWPHHWTLCLRCPCPRLLSGQHLHVTQVMRGTACSERQSGYQPPYLYPFHHTYSHKDGSFMMRRTCLTDTQALTHTGYT